MALGDRKYSQGSRGSQHNYEHRQLRAIAEITSALAGGAGLATEATLLSILNNMIASQDIEILLVRDTGGANVVVQQIREYDQGTGVWTTRYEDVSGAPYVPVGPLVYLDPSGVLNLILAELQSIDAKVATEGTLAALKVLLDPVTRTPTMLRVTAAGAASIPAGARSACVWNYGNTTALVLGQNLLRGEKVCWHADGEEDTLGAISYDAQTSSLLITYTS